MSGVRIDCWCMTCDGVVAQAQADNGDVFGSMSRLFIVCPDCGNKRCPRATQHDNPCTGSNEPGQPGSAYQVNASPPKSADELRARIAERMTPTAAHVHRGRRVTTDRNRPMEEK